jgi:glycosyltransferase involved in cell wall biosynthesis
MSCGPALRKKALDDFLDLADVMPERSFSLSAIGHTTDELVRRNANMQHPVTIPGPIDHSEMPAEYKKHSWLVKTGDFRRRSMGWPVSIAEAQASGVGVCMANLGDDLKEYVGPGGFLFDSMAEAREIISKPFPEDRRLASFEHAKKSDVATHRSVLTDLWASAST